MATKKKKNEFWWYKCLWIIVTAFALLVVYDFVLISWKKFNTEFQKCPTCGTLVEPERLK